MTLTQLAEKLEGFYQIDRTRILSTTTPEYRRFLREAGYGNLDACSGIEIAKGLLKIDPAVRDAAAGVNLNLTGNNGDYVVNINHLDARKLVEALGYKVPTVGLMYKLFIPYIKELAQNGNAGAQATLNEMTPTKAEWLDDVVLQERSVRSLGQRVRKLKIGTQERRLSLPDKDGIFDRSDINEFGYPNTVKASGEFYYGYPRSNEIAAIRDRDFGLLLNLFREPSVGGGGLGVRLAKIFP